MSTPPPAHPPAPSLVHSNAIVPAAAAPAAAAPAPAPPGRSLLQFSAKPVTKNGTPMYRRQGGKTRRQGRKSRRHRSRRSRTRRNR